MKLLVLLASLTFVNSIEYIHNCCGNGCGFTRTHGCHSDNYNCQPIYTYGCPIGCKMNNDKCIDDLYKNTTQQLLCPINCQDNTCSNKYGCNINGHGDICPLDCNDNGTQCLPQTLNNYCNTFHTCPFGCLYNETISKCTSNKYICDRHNITCPANCTYNIYINYCMPKINNAVCVVNGLLKCPQGCLPNYSTLTCHGLNGHVCSRQPTYACPKNCSYNSTLKLCLPDTLNDICEPTIQEICPYGYMIGNSYPKCNINNVTCIRKINISCHKIHHIIDGCPGCEVDRLRNKCIRNRGDICGHHGIRCPNDWQSIDNLICINNNNITAECNVDYTLKIIVTSIGNFSYCFPDWLY